ncbi:MAG: hypothetical protein GC155_08635 [Alphaproteobacteria bacterium]|nr:hypothetical protein [Alphaproteobacteria bacterium]
MSRKILITLLIVLVPVAGLILAAVFGAGEVFRQFPNANFIIAFSLGATLAVLLSVGLFSLTFLSSRRGFDDRIEPGAKFPSGDDPDRG